MQGNNKRRPSYFTAQPARQNTFAVHDAQYNKKKECSSRLPKEGALRYLLMTVTQARTKVKNVYYMQGPGDLTGSTGHTRD